MGKIDELLGAAPTAEWLESTAAVKHLTASISTMTAPIAHTGSWWMCVVCAGSGRVAMGISVKCSAGPSSEHDIMIILRNSDYCHGGMKICQGHVRTDTRPEQINRTVSFSPTAGTEQEKKKKNEQKKNRGSKQKSYVSFNRRGKASSTRPRACLACNYLPPTEEVSNTSCWLGIAGESQGRSTPIPTSMRGGTQQEMVDRNADHLTNKEYGEFI